MAAGLPAIQDMFTLDAFLLAVLFIIFSMPAAYKMTGRYSEGYVQMFIHGILLFYFFFFFSQFLPTTKFGLARSPTELTGATGNIQGTASGRTQMGL